MIRLVEELYHYDDHDDTYHHDFRMITMQLTFTLFPQQRVDDGDNNKCQ